MTRLTTLCAVTTLLFSFPAAGTFAAESDRTVRLQQIEGLFGVTPTMGAVGDGRLTAQISREGTLTCMRWPNATFYEHVKYRSAAYNEDPEQSGWNLPYFGAKSNAGILSAVRYKQDNQTHVVFFRDADLAFSYAATNANRLNITVTIASGFEILESNFVVPDQPSMIKTFELLSVPADVSNVEIIVLANPALRTAYGSGYDPRPQWSQDENARFATFALADADALISALPRRNLDGRREELDAFVAEDPTKSEIESFVLDTSETWGEGTYFVQAGSVASSDYQVGTDQYLQATGPTDAFADVTDGTLNRDALVTRFETTALALPLATGETIAWYGAFASQAVDAIAAADAMRAEAPVHWQNEADQWWAEWLADAVLPTQSDAARNQALRALISMRTGQDPESGAIIASTSCQPPYNLDWPRDGAFFQFVLELNKKEYEADRHARFYNGLNDEHRLYGPIGSWAMNYYADGTPGGPIDFEIDQVGFGLWVYHLRAAALAQTDPAAAGAFIKDIKESAQLAADLLVTCRDDGETEPTQVDARLQCPANEDDNPPFVVTLHGAITAWLGLTSAHDMFQAIDEVALAETYKTAADEMSAAIREHFPPSSGKENDDGILGGALAWSFWPGDFWLAEETDELDATRARFEESLRRTLVDEKEGTSYDTKSTIALLTPPLRNESTVAFVKEAHRVYLDEVINPLGHMGEGTVHDNFDNDGNKEWKNITATPHIWAQTLLYISLLAEERPELLALPKLGDLEGNKDTGGCGVAPGDAQPFFWLLLPVAWVLWRRRR